MYQKKQMSLLKAIVMLGIAFIGANAMVIKDSCFECAKYNRGNSFMCDNGGAIPDPNPYAVACCRKGDNHEYCQPSETNVCSPIYNEAKHNFYTYCPKINSTGCGVPDSPKDKILIEANNDVQTFEFDKLVYKNEDWKFTNVGVCHYQVQNPTYYYKSGKVFLKFTEAHEGVKLYLNAGSDVRNSTVEMVDRNNTIEVNKTYEIDQSINYVITAIPEYNNYNTSFAFEYNTDGEQYIWYEWFYYQFFMKHPKGQMMMYIFAGLAILLLCLVFCCLCVCVKSMFSKNNKVEVFDNTELTKTNLARQYDTDVDKSLHIKDMSDDSIDGAAAATDIEGGAPKMIKESKKKHEKEIQVAYGNPFKPANQERNEQIQKNSAHKAKEVNNF